VWTHASAYAQLPEVCLIAGADPDAGARNRFAERRGMAAVYGDYWALLAQERPDLVSICSPTQLHAEMTFAAVEAGVKAIFCEKPLAASLQDARRMVVTCREKGVVLAVNHTRRWDRNYLWPLDILRQGRIGILQRIVAHYPGRIFNMGTHIFDTIHMYTGGPAEWVIGEFAGVPDHNDPTVNGLLSFPKGIVGFIAASNQPADLIFEIDMFGTEGRLRILDNGLALECYQFADSPNYSHYRELHRMGWPNPLPAADRFVQAVRDIVTCVKTGLAPACGGSEGLAALETAVAFCRSASARGSKQILPLSDPATDDERKFL
jgi:predicted dehydrogenase